MKYILSKMTNGVTYCFYDDAVAGRDLPVLRGQFSVSGGTGLPSLKSGWGELGKDEEGKPLWTPEGTITPVSEAVLEKLKTLHVFQSHLERGMIKIIEKDVRGNHSEMKKQMSGMIDRDGHAQLTKATYAGRVKVAANADYEDRM